MRKLSVYLLSIEYLRHTNGVDRHISLLMDGLGSQKNLECYYFSFITDPNLFFLREKRINNNCTKISIPLPNNPNQIFNDSHKLQSFNKEVCDILRKYLVNRKCRILHVHTLNMMPLALMVKKRYACKIISHIHCLSWKYNLEWEPEKFIHQLNMGDRKYKDKKRMLSVTGESEAYNQADSIICVTECGREFVRNMQERSRSPIYMIPNGLYDTFDKNLVKRNLTGRGTIKILFAGGFSKTKGLEFLLDSINQLPDTIRKKVSLIVAGSCREEQQAFVKRKYREICVSFMGMIKYRELEEIYYHADIGAIMSLHEQCSYTAIEMMMHQLPIVSTDVDGLGEMFQDGKNSLLVPIEYNVEEGRIAPNIKVLSQKLLLLINSYDIRKRIGKNGRNTFLKYYIANKMIEHILKIYNRNNSDYET